MAAPLGAAEKSISAVFVLHPPRFTPATHVYVLRGHNHPFNTDLYYLPSLYLPNSPNIGLRSFFRIPWPLLLEFATCPQGY